jgi:hypothetical protein
LPSPKEAQRQNQSATAADKTVCMWLHHHSKQQKATAARIDATFVFAACDQSIHKSPNV